MDMDELNGLCYCAAHAREVCHDCGADYTVFVNEMGSGFQLPENGIPEYPRMVQYIPDKHLRECLSRRWLDMQRAQYPGVPAPLTASLVRIPRLEVPEEVKTSTGALQGTLLQLFRQLQGMASTQRYYFANQSKIMLEDYDIFKKGAVLYQEEVSDQMSRKFDLFALRGVPNLPPAQREHERVLKAKSSILNTFGFFLELSTQRTFWRAMELTVDAYLTHVESFEEEADSQVVMTDRAKVSFLQWLGHFFWALQHSQFQLNGLRAIQLEVYQRQTFPFFPYSLKALEQDLDINLVIAQISKGPIHDLPLFSSLFSKLKQASTIRVQMKSITADLMAAIDELSTRFRFLETLILIANLITTEDEIQSALVTFQFNPQGREVSSRTDDVMAIMSNVHDGDSKEPPPKKPSFLQRLIIKENLFRQKKSEPVMQPPFTTDEHSGGFSNEMFITFKSNFTFLYRESIRRQWKEDEYSLLGLDVARRSAHRQDMEKKKRMKKKQESLGSYEEADIREVRSVPDKVLDPYLFWRIGDGTLEKYVPPVVRKKIKTRKQGITDEQDEVVAGNEGIQTSTPSSNDAPSDMEDASPQIVPRPVDQLKHTDLVTRDILWRKIKGNLKWTQLVQFLSRLGCQILNLDGSKRKIVDNSTGRCTVLHRPHPGDDCRPDQRESYRIHIEDWLKIGYDDLVPAENAATESYLLGDMNLSNTDPSNAAKPDAQASS